MMNVGSEAKLLFSSPIRNRGRFPAILCAMTPIREITFTLEVDEDSTALVASWDDPSGKGGSTTQGEDFRELQEMIQDATTGYFRALGEKAPDTVRLQGLPSWCWRTQVRRSS